MTTRSSGTNKLTDYSHINKLKNIFIFSIETKFDVKMWRRVKYRVKCNILKELNFVDHKVEILLMFWNKTLLVSRDKA